MQFTQETLDILKNFTLINPSIAFKKGSTIQTISPAGNLVGQVKVEEVFPQDFCIFELSKLLSIIQMMSTKNQKAEVEFFEKYLVVRDENEAEVQFNFASENNITAAPYKPMQMPKHDFKFKKNLDKIIKAAGTLGVPNIIIEGTGKNVFLKCGNAKIQSGNNYKENLGSYDEEFRVVLNVEFLIMLAHEYDIEVSSKGIIHLNSGNLDYWIATKTE